ncbi:dicarboxylate transporter/tellurite-resistance protein TehA [Paraburkholderia tropica]|uniref:dicarboxylate transporter/tellurite-resistance protein TehA n=1 Tax=Paraburkholderia tropica TaxID=92647 RepID=UPI003D2D529D
MAQQVPESEGMSDARIVMSRPREPMPAGFFGMAVGILALAATWRVGVRLWHLPVHAATAATALALLIWVTVLAGYARKWRIQREAAIAEWNHPIHSSLIALGPVSTMLASQAVLSWSRYVAITLFAVGVATQLGLGVALHGRLWQGGRRMETITPVVYLPTVAPSFVAAATSAAFGWPSLGALFFGAGMLAWLANESLILQSAAEAEPVAAPLRPTLGIQLAPPVVGGVAWLGVSGGVPDYFAYGLLGYGLYQALLLLRLLPWISKQPFTPSYWGFSFGVAALPTMAMLLVEHGASDLFKVLACTLFIAANVVIGILILLTINLMLNGKLLPAVQSGRLIGPR